MEAQRTTAAMDNTTGKILDGAGRLILGLPLMGLALALAPPATAATAATAANGATQEPEIVAGSYVRAKAGAVVRNFRDDKGKMVAEMEAESLLLVHGQSRNFYEVSSPIGFPVWVHGKYLAKTGTDGVLKVVGRGVRMRPLPESTVDSYPLTAKLNRGDLVQFIERADESKAADADWIHVWSVPAAHGWVSTSEVIGAAAQDAAGSEWTATLRGLVDVPVEVAAGATSDSGKAPAASNADQDPQASTAVDKIPEEAYRSLAYGKTLLDGALKKGQDATEADFDSSIRAFDTVLKMVPADSVVAAEANSKLKEANTHRTVAGVRAELAAAEVRQREMVAEWAEAQRRAELERTAHWGRFMGRGWVDKTGRGDDSRYFLRWGGEAVFEISCDSGRYDLELFRGYELGVRGTTLRAASMATEDTPAQVPLLDISRLEVISGSPVK